jgi:hypothetical protein
VLTQILAARKPTSSSSTASVSQTITQAGGFHNILSNLMAQTSQAIKRIGLSDLAAAATARKLEQAAAAAAAAHAEAEARVREALLWKPRPPTALGVMLDSDLIDVMIEIAEQLQQYWVRSKSKQLYVSCLVDRIFIKLLSNSFVF